MQLNEALPETRARYTTPINAFRTVQSVVPAHAFFAERERALAPTCETGVIELDLSERLGTPYAATTPSLLCRYVVLRAGEALDLTTHSTGTVHYVMRGTGSSRMAGEIVAWDAGDTMLLPGGVPIHHAAGPEGAILFLADDEPTLRFYGAVPDQAAPRAPIVFRAEEIERQFTGVYERGPAEDLAGKAVFLTHEHGGPYGTITPSMVSVFNSLEPGADQRAHRHNAVAISIAIAGDGVHAFADEERVDWLPGLVMITPPCAVHSIHNRGNAPMRVLTVQDSGLFYHLRATGFAFAEG